MYLQLSDIHKKVHDGSFERILFDNLQLTVSQGEWIAIMGRSGSGKSSLLRMMGGLEKNYQGDIVVHGQPLKKMTDRELAIFRNQKIGFIFQDFNLLSHLSVVDNVRLPYLLSGRLADNERVGDWLKKVGLENKSKQKARTLSGGEQQRVAIARAMCQKPDLLLCDEPTGNLDKRTADVIENLFCNLHTQGITIVMVTHDQELATKAQKRYTLEQGQLQCI